MDSTDLSIASHLVIAACIVFCAYRMYTTESKVMGRWFLAFIVAFTVWLSVHDFFLGT